LGSRFRVLLWLVVVCIGLMVALYLLLDHYAGEEGTAARTAGTEAREEHLRFAARFDSLYHARMLPTVWKLGVFTRTSFDADFEQWTLTISATDWYNRGTPSKRDLVATLWAAYRGAREQAGGDPDAGVLVLEDNDGNRVAEASSGGVSILR
jgi:hypothetical protein